jgi:hypothetical protein
MGYVEQGVEGSGIGRQKENDVGVKGLMTDLMGGSRSHTYL